MADEDLLVRARLENDLSAPLAEVRRDVARTTDSVRASDRAAASAARGGWSRLNRVIGHNTRDLRGMIRQLDRAAISAGRLAGRGLYRLSQALAVGTAAVTGFGLKAASTFEQTRVAFETMLGPQGGRQLFTQLQELNKRTPFDLPQITQATQLLLRYGVAGDQVLNTLTPLIDIAALSGPDAAENLLAISRALGQVISTGRLQGDEARQFAEAGINVYTLLSETTGKSVAEVRKLGEAGKISSEQLLGAIQGYEGGLERFRGGAEKQSRTLAGMLSNFRDAITIRLADTAGPLVESLKVALPLLTELVGSTLDRIGPPLIRLGDSFLRIGTALLPVLEPILAGLAQGIAAIAGPLAKALQEQAPAFAVLGPALAELGVALAPLAPVFVDLLVAMTPLLVMVLTFATKVATRLIPVIEDGVEWFSRMTRTSRTFRGVLFALAGGFVAVRTAIAGYRALQTVVGVIHAITTALWGQAAAGNAAAAASARATGAGAAGAGGRAAAGGLLGRLGIGAAAGAGGGALGIGAGLLATVGLLAGGILISRHRSASEHPDRGRYPDLTRRDARALERFNRSLRSSSGDAYLARHPELRMARDNPNDPNWGRGGDVTSQLERSVRAHAALEGGTPGIRSISSGVRGGAAWGSGHRDGSALDLTGSGLQSYAEAVGRAGGYARVHRPAGQGAPHVHAAYGDVLAGPRAGGRGGGGVVLMGPLVYVERVDTTVDLERATVAGVERLEASRRGRQYRRQQRIRGVR